MLAWYVINWILFIVYTLVYIVNSKERDEDEVFCAGLLATIGFLTPFAIYEILDILSEYEPVSGYQRFMRDSKRHSGPHIYLTFKQVKQFYAVNPDKWKVYDTSLLYTPNANTYFVVLFRNPIDFYRTVCFFQHETKKPTAAQVSVEDQNMKRFLEYVRKDIDALNAQAEKEFNEARSLVERIKAQDNVKR